MPRLMGRKRDWAFAREKLNDDFAKHIAARLLRSNGAGGYETFLLYDLSSIFDFCRISS